MIGTSGVKNGVQELIRLWTLDSFSEGESDNERMEKQKTNLKDTALLTDNNLQIVPMKETKGVQ